MKNPIWIIVESGDLFEGAQMHWSNCFFSNAFQSEIECFCERMKWKLEIREMTDEEVIMFPDAVPFVQWLIDQYGEA